MPGDARSRETAHHWLRYAEGNLARAKQEKPEVTPWEYMCFDAQQAAEKAVKAVLVFHEIEFPRTHELGELLALARQAGERIPEDLWEASGLSIYATHTRYPGGEPPATEDDYREAVALAEKVVRWAEGIIYGR